MSVRYLVGDALAMLKTLPSDSVHCCVTSVPYWGLRAYLPDDHPDRPLEIGREPTPDAWAARLVEVFREVRRVLRPDGVCFLNVGDSYAGSWGNQGRKEERGSQRPINGEMLQQVHDGRYPSHGSNTGKIPTGSSLKPKDLVGAPWLLAFALRADGWWLRSEIIWAKPNPMPESVTDRPTKSHEQVFLLTKSERYFWDQEAVREAHKPESLARYEYGLKTTADPNAIKGSLADRRQAGIGNSERMGDFMNPAGRNLRSVWQIATEPCELAHFATMPTELARRCILAGTSAKGVCPACGAPWARVVERTPLREIAVGMDGDLPKKRARQAMGLASGRSALSASNSHNGSTPQSPIITTTGWRPTCSCPPAEPVPATVLDPFGGAGTTSLVSEQLGRDSIYIDLSPAYASMAHARIERAKARRFIGDAERIKPLEGQLGLFMPSETA